METFAVVMAGGSGTRLWPLSREAMPKQFIAVDGNKSMLESTLERLQDLVPGDKCFVITNKNLTEATRATTHGLIPPENIITEPMRRDTAGCVAYAAMLLRKKYGPGLLCCVPADGHVQDKRAYASALALGLKACEENRCLALIGLRPTYPATGYGYMLVNPELQVTPVDQFTEKPDEETAKQMVASGRYWWNSGIFLGDLDLFVEGVRTHLPDYYEKIGSALLFLGQLEYEAAIEAAYGQIKPASFDRSVLEKMKESGSIYAVQGLFDWDDIGSLDAFAKFLEAQDSGNFVYGNHCMLDTSGCVILARDGVLVATIGMQDIIVAATKDAVLVAPREKAQEVKTLVDELKKKGLEKFV